MNYFDYSKNDRNLDFFEYGEWQRRYGRMVARCLNLHGKKVLDIGCAAGAHVKSFVDIGKADAYGCDINAKMVRQTPFIGKRKRLKVVPTDRLSDYYNEDEFDIVHSSQVFEHFPSKVYSIAVIAEIFRVLKPSGIVYVSLVTGKHKTVEDLKNTPDDDITHINIWPRAFWVDVFGLMGFVDVTDEYQKRFDKEAMYREYEWAQMIWMKPEHETKIRIKVEL